MLYILSVVYNEVVDDRFTSFISDSSKVIIFDNSIDEKIRKTNKNKCNEFNYLYETLNYNCGLSRSYNYILKKYITDNDWILILDSDTSIKNDILPLIFNCIQTDKFLVYTTKNFDSAQKYLDSPKEIDYKFLYFSKHYIAHKSKYLMTINNGLLISGKIFKKIGYYDERIFLYFSDSLFCICLEKNKIPMGVLNYENYCHFSFHHLNAKSLRKKLQLMKKDANVFYKIIYSNKLKSCLHYLFFNIKKSLECTRNFKLYYFVYFFFSGRQKNEN